MAQNEGFVGLDVGKFEIYVFISKTGSSFSVPNTASAMPDWGNRPERAIPANLKNAMRTPVDALFHRPIKCRTINV
jgi:hypothetical protein